MIGARSQEVAGGAFEAAGDRWKYSGTLTFDNASTVAVAAARLPLPASGVVDLAGLAHADSAALAVLLELQRRAAGERRQLEFVALPPALDSLARVYGVDELLAY